MRWTMLIALVGLVACKGGGGVDDTEAPDDTSVDDTASDDTAVETGAVTIEVDFPTKPAAGPLIIAVSSSDRVFESILYTESFADPNFPAKQTHVLDVEPGDYYFGAWIDEGADNPNAPAATEPKGASVAGTPTLVTVETGGTYTPPLIKLRRPETDKE